MQVETFEAIEVDAVTGEPECDSEAIAIIEKLGLAGQQKLLQRKESEDGTTVARCPYRKMTAEEQAVYQVICPKSCKLHEYADGPIPLRVLQVAAHATEFFDEIRVWSATSAEIKDPVLVGLRDKDAYGNPRSLFILARWGEVLEDFGVLAKRAAEKAKAIYREGLEEVLASAQTALAVIERAPAATYIGKSRPWTNVS